MRGIAHRTSTWTERGGRCPEGFWRTAAFIAANAALEDLHIPLLVDDGQRRALRGRREACGERQPASRRRARHDQRRTRQLRLSPCDVPSAQNAEWQYREG